MQRLGINYGIAKIKMTDLVCSWLGINYEDDWPHMQLWSLWELQQLPPVPAHGSCIHNYITLSVKSEDYMQCLDQKCKALN